MPKPPDRAQHLRLTVVVDNLVNIFLPSQGPLSYPQPGPCSSLLAEQGLSLWIEVDGAQGNATRVLYDFGRGAQVLGRNLRLLQIDPATAAYLVLSHGHIDHYGGLLPLLAERQIAAPLVAHPAAFGTRGIQRPDGSLAGPWRLEQARVEEALAGPPLISAEPRQLGPGLWTSGRIGRVSPLDRPFRAAVRQQGWQWVADDFEDDQAIFVNLEDRGLVVVTGCCHAGVFNTLARAQALFPGVPLYALVGGLHWNFLSDNELQDAIAELAGYDPQWLLAMHCTGALAQHRLRERFAERCPFNTVGLRCSW
ncbi:MAG: MBL fold metallo-hydrolase [Desulfarculus sp.]|nr:MAG: MBL fold metallo-hydrolase [Desulfarculus sp.]